MSTEIYSSLSWFDNYVQLLLISMKNNKLGVELDKLPISLSTYNTGKTRNCHLNFFVPYAKQILKWEMCFNPLYPELGPDLIFVEEDYLQNDTIHNFATHVPSLAKWSSENNSSLLEVINDLLQLYKKYQINLLKLHAEKLICEYNSLQGIICPENFEIIIIHELKQIEIRFLLKLDIDLSKVFFSHNEVKNTKALLVVYFYGPTYNCAVPELYLPSYLENLINGSEALHIPPFLETNHLEKYAAEVKDCLSDKVSIISQNIKNRKNFITSLLVLQYATVIEYDVTTYTRVSLLLEHLDFYFILSFQLPINFPSERFSMILCSTYHMTEQGKPISSIINNFPYDSHWEMNRMIAMALAYILENEIKRFQEISVKI